MFCKSENKIIITNKLDLILTSSFFIKYLYFFTFYLGDNIQPTKKYFQAISKVILFLINLTLIKIFGMLDQSEKKFLKVAPGANVKKRFLPVIYNIL